MHQIYIVLSRVVIVTDTSGHPVLCLVFLSMQMMVLTKVAPNMNVFFSHFIFSMIGGMILLFTCCHSF